MRRGNTRDVCRHRARCDSRSPSRCTSPDTTFRVAEGIAVLERTPAALRALLAGHGDEWLRCNEGAETWGAFDVVGHLIDGEETDWIPRARIILGNQANRTFVPFDRFRHLERNRGRSIDELLDEFATLRAKNLATLSGWKLSEDQLALTGQHPELGEVTLRQLLATWVAHDLGHIAQIGRVMAKRYREAVGPWRAYLPVMDR